MQYRLSALRKLLFFYKFNSYQWFLAKPKTTKQKIIPLTKVNFSLRESRDPDRGRFTERKIKLLSELSGGGVGAGETLRK